MRSRWFASLVVAVAASVAGCSDDAPPQPASQSATASVPSNVEEIPPRWYAPEDVARGAAVYARHCAACHGAEAQGAGDWRVRGPDGKFPPPPLNGTAHTWHHPVAALRHQILYGAPGGSGNMPGFEGRLGEEEVLAVIAWFQDLWRDEIYAAWHTIEMRSRETAN